MIRRGDPKSLSDMLNSLSERVRTLEDTSSRRVLPAGFTWTVNETGGLVVVRDSDGATQVVLNG